ncbi:homocysteine S-methyltransferase YbgG-like [Bacillus rossius redtenbacheri]|uniref:homocysteine S-methyltransferase YbgG-like n=1 Tax=Bacillus rossius redtenbacheri TaxID=93214 RepID=UPI002FDD1B51
MSAVSISDGVVVLDGGFATQLCRHVTEPIDGNPLWSASFLASDPQAVVKTHLDFLRAGAEAIITNTYQASIDGFMTHLGLSEDESYALIKKAVELAQEAVKLYMDEFPAARRPLVVGSVGPYGASLHDYSEYTGDYVERVGSRELRDWHRPRVRALVEAGVDILALETVPAQTEGEALVQLMSEFPRSKAWLSFSCKDDTHTSHGEKFQDAARACWDRDSSQLVAVGVNCVNPSFVSSLFTGINKGRQNCPIPLVVYPNSGEKYDLNRGWVEVDSCKPVHSFVKDWLDLGVVYVGGCCRTYADDVKNISREVKEWLADRKQNNLKA